ncbi:hypothetical protein ANOM_007322 [Aspergillus nomiae NRRL 13137]|uniref:DUF7136 domain-containing protein n=1 Tax=Aspergillus nomiae NRRL (strain ATCC 15546 / NRRL 13137 / CBS 260.88 / M93) TaxID=1509407 RepID=A0A0L1IVS0_ASPN3|nr:uncharacterized protein ANOM_007322 [Aspergillus nomiae NRRL 13137]KNG83666.1 hypothetical protein ANOM_007322 [Aspergillus nomiae NRRL 13137]
MGPLPRGWLRLALSLCLACGWASIIPGVAEVDLIFPRNGSYPPSTLTPIIFAIQNPSLLSSVHPRIRYYIDQVNVNSSEKVSYSGSIELEKVNFTGSDPSFLYWSTSKFDIEGTFEIIWALDMYNCSREPESTDFTLVYLGGHGGSQSFFSIKNGTSPPDFVALTEDDTCEETLAQAIHVPELLNVPSGQIWGSVTRTTDWYAPKPTWRGSYCAVTADRLPTARPCNVKIDSSAATSISAALTGTACANPLRRTGLSCPTPSSENAAPVGPSYVERPWILVMGLLLAYGLA